MLAQCHCTCFDDHILERNLYRTEFIHLRPCCHGIIHIDLHGEIEMRSRELAFAQAACNRFPHLAIWSIREFFFSGRSKLRYWLLATGCRSGGFRLWLVACGLWTETINICFYYSA